MPLAWGRFWPTAPRRSCTSTQDWPPCRYSAAGRPQRFLLSCWGQSGWSICLLGGGRSTTLFCWIVRRFSPSPTPAFFPECATQLCLSLATASRLARPFNGAISSSSSNSPDVPSWQPFSTESPPNRRITTSTTATRAPHTDQSPDQGGRGMRMLKSVWIGLLIMAVICCAGPSLAQTSANQAHESLLIGPGDLLRVTVLRESDLTQNVRVRDSGEVTLPLIGNVQVRGLSAADAAAAIATKYVEGQFLKHPDVSVFVEEYATQPVSVLGQVVKPGLISISTPRSLVDVLAMAGGLTDQADRHITVERGGNTHGLEEVFLSNRPEDALNANVEIFPGDKILVPKAGIVYVLGDVGKPGGYLMQNNSRLTGLEAVAMAAGVNRTASENRARVIHNQNGQYQERELLLKDIQEGKAPDQLLEADDVIYIPFSFGKNILMGTNSIVAATSSALIYAGR